MPTATFLHLPAEKRERFTTAALDEFAVHDYRTASVSRIARAAGIAKGSVYQYFDGKQDLYLHLVTLAAERKFGFIDGSLPADASGFFTRFRLTVFHGARFDFTHPKLAGLLYNATYEPTGPETRAVSAQLKAASQRYIRGLVDAGIRAGDLRADLDVDFAVFALYQLSVSLRDYMSERFDFSFADAVRHGGGSPVPEDDLMAVLDAFVDVLERGMALRSAA
ncbi:MAG: TetR/AcrR family transcriptional regulator [Trueperaceae bacterium]|nr:MAG: TetR/AcrR family transcriptional regulator [Trueperaceae bacterium]